MKLTRLKIKYFQGLEDLDFQPSLDINLIEGQNGAGKTSVLEAIRVAFTNRGQRSLLVHGLEPEGLILFEMDDGTIGQREVNRKGRTGGPLELSIGSSTREFLDGLGLGFGFNPLAFLDLHPNEQTKQLLSITPVTITQAELVALAGGRIDSVDYSAHPLTVLQDIGDYLFDERSELRKRARETEAALTSLKEDLPANFDSARAEQLDTTALVQELTSAERVQELQASLSRRYRTACEERDRIIQDIADLEQAIKSADDERSKYRDVDTIKADLSSFEEEKKNLARWRLVEANEREAQDYRNRAKLMHETLERVREKPADLLAHTQLPVKGLGIDVDGKVTINALPISELSTGEQLKVAVDIAVATLGNFPVVLVDGFEALDNNNQTIVIDRLREANVQAFIATIGDGDLTVVTDYMDDYKADLPVLVNPANTPPSGPGILHDDFKGIDSQINTGHIDAQGKTCEPMDDPVADASVDGVSLEDVPF